MSRRLSPCFTPSGEGQRVPFGETDHAIGEWFGTDYSRLKFRGSSKRWRLESHKIGRAVGK